MSNRNTTEKYWIPNWQTNPNTPRVYHDSERCPMLVHTSNDYKLVTTQPMDRRLCKRCRRPRP